MNNDKTTIDYLSYAAGALVVVGIVWWMFSRMTRKTSEVFKFILYALGGGALWVAIRNIYDAWIAYQVTTSGVGARGFTENLFSSRVVPGVGVAGGGGLFGRGGVQVPGSSSSSTDSVWEPGNPVYDQFSYLEQAIIDAYGSIEAGLAAAREYQRTYGTSFGEALMIVLRGAS